MNRAFRGCLLLLVSVCAICVALVGRAQPVQAQAAGQTLIVTKHVWPRAMAFDGTNVWIANGFDNTVIRFAEDDKASPVGSPITVGSSPTAMAWDPVQKLMWVAGYDDYSLTLVDQAGKVDARSISNTKGSPLDTHPIGLVYAKTFMWVLTQETNNTDTIGKPGYVWKFNTATVKPEKPNKLTVGKFPTAITASADQNFIWVTNGNEDSISQIDVVKDGGSVTATYTDSVPAFPIAIAFDGVYLWVGNYEGKIVKFNAGDGSPVDLAKLPKPLNLPGRPVAVMALNGHVWIANAHDPGATDVDSQGNQQVGSRQIVPNDDKHPAYVGAVLMTDHYVYLADWLNDQVLRVSAPTAIAIQPTAIPSATPLPSATPTATATPPPCNPDPKFPPQFKPGDVGQVKKDADTASVQIHNAPSLDPGTLVKGKVFPLGAKFKVQEGPLSNIDPKTPPVCFYKVVGVDDTSLAGYITEGGIPDSADKKHGGHYFVEPVPAS